MPGRFHGRSARQLLRGIALFAALSGAITSCSDPHASASQGTPPLTHIAGQATPPYAIAFSTSIGGSGNDEMVRDVVTDAAGNIYIAGGTDSPDFPVTPHAFDTTFNNPGSAVHDVFVMKLSPDGQLIWSTFIGGPGYDRAYAIELDPQGFVYVAGRAGAGMPVTPDALQRNFAGGDAGPYGEQDGFVCKLEPDGSALVYCTYFGNEDLGVIRDIDVDAAGNVYLITSAETGDFPSAWFSRSFQKHRRGKRDVLIAKLHASGARVEWATYLGGSGEEHNTNTIRLDRDGQHLYALINTRSPDMPTPNGFDRKLGGRSDVYLAKLAVDGSRIVFGTYIGGSHAEGMETHHLWIAPTGEPVVTGVTHSTDFPTTPGAFQRTYGGSGGRGTGRQSNYGGDGFIAKVSADGSRLIAATYFGGSLGDGIEGVGVDARGNIFVGGSTFSDVLPQAGPRRASGSADMFAAVFSPDLRRLLHFERVGGRGEDTNRTAFVDPEGAYFLFAGISKSPQFPRTHLERRLAGSGQDGALVKIVGAAR